MNRAEKILEAINTNCLLYYQDRPVGLISQLARISDSAHSTIRSACSSGNIRMYELTGCILALDAEDLAIYFKNARRGRPRKIGDS